VNISLLYNVFMGETSPLIAARIDSPAHEMGARRMENMIPMLTGGLRKRPGTWYDGTTGLPSINPKYGKVRLIPWITRNGTWILELTDSTVRFWTKTGDGKYAENYYYTNTNLKEEYLPNIQYAASNNTIWLVHQDMVPIVYPIPLGISASLQFTGKNFAVPGYYPGAVAFFAGRLCFAGMKNEPNRIYMSRAPNSLTGEKRHLDFTTGDNPADAIVLEENDMHGSQIQWITASKRFLVATERATWSDTGDIPTPATFDLNIIEHKGSHKFQAHGCKEMVVYIGRNGKSLHALVWNDNTQNGSYIDLDISEYAAHLFTAGIKDFAIMDYPYSLIWIVTNDGTLVSCTIDIRRGIIAYAKHPTDGMVEAVAVLAEETEDVLFMVVRRGTDQNVEHLFLKDLINEDFTDSHYVDAGEKHTFSTPTTKITGLHRLRGKIIRVFADGVIEPPVKVHDNASGGYYSGEVGLQNAVTKVHLGLPYKAVFSPNERQIPANGTSVGKKRKIEKITLKTYKTIGGKAGVTEEKSTELITQRYGGYVLGSAPEPFTGEVDVTVAGNIDTEGKLIITHEEPVPFTMLALVERVTILEA